MIEVDKLKCYGKTNVTESLLQFLKRLTDRFIMLLVTQLKLLYFFGLFCNPVDVSRSVYAQCPERSLSLFFSQIPCSVTRFNHVNLQFYLLIFQICVGLVFSQVCFSSAQFLAIVFYRFSFQHLFFCKLGVTWAFILIPSNQDVIYLFYAFDSFPVT